MNILVVEDDSQLAELLGRVFGEEGHATRVVDSLRKASKALDEVLFDVVVLDRMLPDGDGLDLCRRLQARNPPLPVLLLTARGEVQDRVSGLRLGADDYITKPFEVEELLARVDAVARRISRAWVSIVGPLEIDRRAQLARLNGDRLDLTAREYAVLARLADQAEECVPRATLLADVWHMSFDPGSGLIDVHMSRLRDKLGQHAWMIETVRGQGFRLRATK